MDDIQIYNKDIRNLNSVIEKNQYGSLKKLINHHDISNYIIEIAPNSIAEITYHGPKSIAENPNLEKSLKWSYVQMNGYGDIIIKNGKGLDKKVSISWHRKHVTVLSAKKQYIINNGAFELKILMSTNFKINEILDFEFNSKKEDSNP